MPAAPSRKMSSKPPTADWQAALLPANRHPCCQDHQVPSKVGQHNDQVKDQLVNPNSASPLPSQLRLHVASPPAPDAHNKVAFSPGQSPGAAALPLMTNHDIIASSASSTAPSVSQTCEHCKPLWPLCCAQGVAQQALPASCPLHAYHQCFGGRP
jgi:hypothetical protein